MSSLYVVFVYVVIYLFIDLLHVEFTAELNISKREQYAD